MKGLSADAKSVLDIGRAMLKTLRPDRAAKRERPEQAIKAFYNSWQWKKARYAFLKDRERKCACCGAGSADSERIVVDHIRPVRHFWHLRLDLKNLQILCDSCNRGKGSDDATDWREPSTGVPR